MAQAMIHAGFNEITTFVVSLLASQINWGF